MKFLADMGISPRTVNWLRSRGYNAIHLVEEGLERLDDGAILAKAHAEGRIVLTVDLDFGYLLAVSGALLPSVIIFRLRNESYEIVNQRLSEVLSHRGEDLTVGAIVSVSDDGLRMRKLPIRCIHTPTQFIKPANPTPSPVTPANPILTQVESAINSSPSWLKYFLNILIHVSIGLATALVVFYGLKVACKFRASKIGQWVLKQLNDAALEPDAYQAQVVLDNLILWDTPSLDANQIDKLVHGQQLVILEESSDEQWLRVRLETDVEGWVEAGNLEQVLTISGSDRALPEQSNNSDPS